MNQSWTSGYVADIAYIEGFYVQQSPARMALACLFGNVAPEVPEPDDPACYLELGCGLGIGALGDTKKMSTTIPAPVDARKATVVTMIAASVVLPSPGGP